MGTVCWRTLGLLFASVSSGFRFVPGALRARYSKTGKLPHSKGSGRQLTAAAPAS